MKKELIETITVGSGGTASIEFTSIPQDGVDLVCFISMRCTTSNATGSITINGSASDFSSTKIYATGTAAGADTQTNSLSATYTSAQQVEAAETANTFSNGQFYISNYAGSSSKPFSYDSVTENNASVAQMVVHAGIWDNTAAITSFKINARSGSLAEHSTASLYKVVTE